MAGQRFKGLKCFALAGATLVLSACVWAPTRSAGLTPVGLLNKGGQAVSAKAAPTGTWDDEAGGINPAALVDAKAKPVRPDGAPPDPGMPTIKVLDPTKAEPAQKPPGVPTLEELAGELPVYEVEAPPLPAASAFVLKQVVSNTLPGGDAGLSGVVRNMFGKTRPVVAGAWVVVVSAADATKRAERQTDAQGRYRLSGIAPGGYFVLASLGAGGVRVEPQYIVLPDGEVGNVNFAVYKP